MGLEQPSLSEHGGMGVRMEIALGMGVGVRLGTELVPGGRTGAGVGVVVGGDDADDAFDWRASSGGPRVLCYARPRAHVHEASPAYP